MSVTDLEAPTMSGPDAGSGPRRRLIVAAACLVALVGGWWWLSSPALGSGGFSGVWSSDHDIVRVTGPDTEMFVVPADTAGETTLMFELRNDGRLPVRLVDVWSDPPPSSCFWAPRVRELRDDPATMYTRDGVAQPAVGATIAAGASTTVWITGAHPNPSRCTHGGTSIHDTVDIVAAVAGRTSTLHVPLGYAFAYSDHPEASTDRYGVEIVPKDPERRED